MVDHSRIYFEGGSFLIFPNKQFSEKELISVEYGAVGFEIFFYERSKLSIPYYFEIGFTNVKAQAEKLLEKPHYSNGLTFTTGFRFHPF